MQPNQPKPQRNSLDVIARLDSFRALKDGWADGASPAPGHASLDWLAAAFRRHYPDDLQPPFTYPTIAGGVQFEWTLGSQDITLDIDLAAKTAVWHQLDLSEPSDEGKVRELDLADPTAWGWLTASIRALATAAA